MLSLGLPAFDHHPKTRLVFGEGVSAQVGELTRWTGAKRVLVVTDEGIARAGILEKIQTSLHQAGIETVVYDRVHENPTTVHVEDCLACARDAGGIDTIVGLGGGSSLDTAKGCNFLLTNGGRMQDYWGYGKAAHPMLPLVAVPTTAGTGSECQSYALIMDAETHQKMACGDPKNLAAVAILDPVLTVSQPREVTACTGIDAISHALESAVTKKRTPLSLMYSKEAWQLLSKGFPRVLAWGGDLQARGEMQLGAALAGMAIENSMLGAAHAAANPLTARYGTVHGRAIGVMLPAVLRFNAVDPLARETYHELAVDSASQGNPGEALAERVESFLRQAGLPKSLSEIGASESDIDSLASSAAEQWTGKFNPREVGAEDFVRIYEEALVLPRSPVD